MKTNGNDKSLESHKIFPILAWVVTLSFAVFVYNITVELSGIVSDLQRQTDQLEEKANTAPDQIENFDIR